MIDDRSQLPSLQAEPPRTLRQDFRSKVNPLWLAATQSGEHAKVFGIYESEPPTSTVRTLRPD